MSNTKISALNPLNDSPLSTDVLPIVNGGETKKITVANLLGTSQSSGTSGTSGTSGSSGLQGASGTNGTSGTSGTSGSSGQQGATGTNGTSGTSGASGDVFKTTSTDTLTITGSGTTQNFTVATGLAYTKLQDVIIYYNLTNHMHGSVTDYNDLTGAMSVDIVDSLGSGTYSSWTINLDGAAGGDGKDGTNGTSGTSGTSGSSGLQGATGTNGTSGTSGTSGIAGTHGTSGTSGTSGSSGSSGIGTNGTSGTSGTSGNGTAGTSGTSGTSGTIGPQGTNGTSGTSGTSGNTGTHGTSGTSGTSGVIVTDGSTTVSSVTTLTFSGATVSNNGTGNAKVTVSGGGTSSGSALMYQITLNTTGGNIDTAGTPIASVIGPNGENKTTLEGLGWSFSCPTNSRLTVNRPSSKQVQPLVNILIHGVSGTDVYTTAPRGNTTTPVGFTSARQTYSGGAYTILDIYGLVYNYANYASSGTSTVIITFGLIS